MFVGLCVGRQMSLCLSVCLSVRLSVCLPVRLSVWVSRSGCDIILGLDGRAVLRDDVMGSCFEYPGPSMDSFSILFFIIK
ncbi:hypothetical protein F5X97DRAFT_290432 [Nemania serpens]|nr:hypothetical protein F5X97DRAFT_290432 [Nemania serpens]